MKNQTVHWQTTSVADSDNNIVSLQDQKILQNAWLVAASVLDPEVPAVTVAELGILRDVSLDSNGVVVAKLTPTYSGCPAVLAIEVAVKDALESAGYAVRIERVLSPPWTTDWISDAGLEKLRNYGIAPPVKKSTSKRALFSTIDVPCPKCQSDNTTLVSEFGSTACKAHYRCDACHEPFDYFKCL